MRRRVRKYRKYICTLLWLLGAADWFKYNMRRKEKTFKTDTSKPISAHYEIGLLYTLL